MGCGLAGCCIGCRPLNSDRTELAPIVGELTHKSGLLNDTRGGIRTHNLLLRREPPRPLGHTSCVFHSILIQSSVTSPYVGSLAGIAHGSPPVVRVPLPPPFVRVPLPPSFVRVPLPFVRVALPPPFVRVPLRLRGGGRGGGGGGRIRHRPGKPMGSPSAGSNPAPSSFCSRSAPSPFCSRPAPSPFRSRPALSPFCSRPAPSARWGSGSLRAGSSPTPFQRPIEPKRSSLHSAQWGRAETHVAWIRAEDINRLDYSRSAFNFTTEAHQTWDDIMQERERNGGWRGGCVHAASSSMLDSARIRIKKNQKK